MCVAIPGKIVEIYKNNEAMIDFSGIKRRVNTFFLDEVVEGEYVLVHVGCAIERLEEKEALENIKLFEELLGGASRDGE